MFTINRRRTALSSLALAVVFSITFAPLPIVRAADHAEATIVAE